MQALRRHIRRPNRESIEREKLLSAFGEGFEADWANIAFTGVLPEVRRKNGTSKTRRNNNEIVKRNKN